MKWIPIVGIPPEDGRYIIYEPRYKWIGVSSVRQGKWDDESATHYMPLPEKPENFK